MKKRPSKAAEAEALRNAKELLAEAPIRAKITKRDRDLEKAYADGAAEGHRQAARDYEETAKSLHREISMLKRDTDRAMEGLFLRFARCIYQLGRDGSPMTTRSEADRA